MYSEPLIKLLFFYMHMQLHILYQFTISDIQ